MAQIRSSFRFSLRVGRVLVSAILVVTLLGACAQLGPQALVTGRPQYNIAVQQTESEQLLLNIVRQRYNDPVLFLDVTSISSGFSRGVNSSLLGAFGSGSSNGVGTVGGNYGENPYIFYAPNTGEKFVRQMLTPLDIGTVALVLQAGWSIERVLLLIGESTNNQFFEVAESLRDLQRNGQLIIGLEPGEHEGELVMVLIVTPDAVESASYLLVCKAIGIACDGQPLRLRQAFGTPADSKTLALATRSLFSAIYYLSRHVDAPEADIKAGIVSPAPDFNSEQAGTTSALKRLFHIRSSESEPDSASVRVLTTFALLSMLITLQSGDTKGITPLITLPSG